MENRVTPTDFDTDGVGQDGTAQDPDNHARNEDQIPGVKRSLVTTILTPRRLVNLAWCPF